jgi:MFS family permease
VLHRGWWLVTSVYLVVDARLSASELVLVGVAQSLVTLVFEVPAGVLADTVSRTWSLVASQVLMGSAMLATGLVTGFAPLVATQLLWGLSWTLASGADVAWITRTIGTIWVNRQTGSEVRATVHSFLAQASASGRSRAGWPSPRSRGSRTCPWRW